MDRPRWMSWALPVLALHLLAAILPHAHAAEPVAQSLPNLHLSQLAPVFSPAHGAGVDPPAPVKVDFEVTERYRALGRARSGRGRDALAVTLSYPSASHRGGAVAFVSPPSSSSSPERASSTEPAAGGGYTVTARDGRSFSLRFLSDRVLARTDPAGPPVVLMRRVERLGSDAAVADGTVLNAAILICADLIDTYEAEVLALLSRSASPVDSVAPDVQALKALFLPAFRSLANDLATAAANLRRRGAGKEVIDTVGRMAVAVLHTFESQTRWAARALELTRGGGDRSGGLKHPRAPSAKDARALIDLDEIRKLVSEADWLRAEQADGEAAKLLEAARRHSDDPAPLNLTPDQRAKFVKGSRSAVKGLFRQLDRDLEARAEEASLRANSDPDFRWFVTQDERVVNHVRSLIPHLEDAAAERVFQGVVATRLGRRVLGGAADLVEWGEDTARDWGRDMSAYLRDRIHLSDAAPAAAAALESDRKARMGDAPVARRSIEAAQLGQAATLKERGDELFLGKYKVDHKRRLRPKVRLSSGVLTELAYKEHVHLSSDSGLHHDVGLELKLMDPFLDDAAGEVSGRWVTSKGAWSGGANARLLVADVRGGTHAKSVDVTGFAAFDDGTTRSGVFVSVTQEYEKDAATGKVTAKEPITRFNPYYSRDGLFGGSGRVSADVDVRVTPTETMLAAYRASYTHRFGDDTYGSFMATNTVTKGTGGAAGGRDAGKEVEERSSLQLSLTREFGESTTWMPRSSVRVWAGYQEIERHGEEKVTGAAGGVEVTLFGW